jgi:hypothetical protein
MIVLHAMRSARQSGRYDPSEPQLSEMTDLLRPIDRHSVILVCLLAVQTAHAVDSVVTFSEVLYHPAETEGAEWIELHNQMSVDVDMSGWRLEGGADFTFPNDTFIASGAQVVIASDTAKVAGALGPFAGRLANNGEEIRLLNNNDRLMDRLRYGDGGAWPVAPDGSGASLAKTNPDAATSEPASWTWSPKIGGTPGAPNFPRPEDVPLDIVRVVEEAASYRFNEAGDALGGTWSQSPHAVGGNWTEGVGPLGRESKLDDIIGTQLQPPSVNRVVTHYFETEFEATADQVSRADHLQLEHLIDDGAVFLLNGAEVFRFNMPNGAVDSTTLASGGEEAEWSSPVNVSVASLQAGANRLSVEVHQSSQGSSDVVFGARLDFALGAAAEDNPFAGLEINEMSPAGNQPFWVELKNEGPTAIDLSDLVLSISRDPERETIEPAGRSLAPGDYAVFETNAVVTDVDRIFLFNPDRSEVLAAQAASNSLRGRAEADEWLERWLFPDKSTKGEANSFSFNDTIVINEIMYHHRPEPPIRVVGAPVTTEVLVAVDTEWRYNQSGTDLGADWASQAHPIGGNWASGPALIGFDRSDLPEPIRTNLLWPALNDPFVVTYYFETEFTLTQEQFDTLQALELSHLVDDGAAFYVNGTEVPKSRFNLPDSPLDAATLAESNEEADLVGPVSVPIEMIQVGENRLSVEVHQQSVGSGDIVFGATLTAALIEDVGDKSQPYREVMEEWIELFNRGTDPVNMSGWTLENGVTFDFPEGTTIAPGEFLVVSNKPAEFTTKYPTVRIAGEYSGTLANGGDQVMLRDSDRNPADEVVFYDGGRWPGRADGEGSTLELRNPEADNSVPESWADSDETSRGAGWQSFRYRAAGDKFARSSEPTQYHEFIFGLLDGGEFLIDDISVVESPGGEAKQFIQNGGFEGDALGAEPDKWRMLGTHGLHGRSIVVDDPDGAGKVLRVFATDGMWHLHDHAETTLKDGGDFPRISSSKEYDISFRAKWLSGSPLLNTRLYFNRAPQTHVLTLSETSGTPGAKNSRFEENLGPEYAGMRHSPLQPGENESVEVSVRVVDPDGVESAKLLWSRDREFENATMRAASDGSWRATIPAQSQGDVVQFYVEATDSKGAVSTFPAGGANSRALVRWEGSRDVPSDAVANLEIILTGADAATLGRNVNQMTNHRQGATAIYKGQVFYDVGVRLKGSQRGRPDLNRRGFSIRFNSDQKFRGVHESIGLDRSGGWRFGRTYGQDEILIWHFFNRAGGIPSMFNDVVNVRAPGITEGTAQVQLARFTNGFLADQFDRGNDGSIHNYELIYYPTSTSGGREGLKRPNPDSVLGVPLRNMGDNQEAYRYHFQLRNNRNRDDYSGMMETAKLFSLSGDAFFARLPQVIDVEQWLRTYAGVTLAGVSDSYFNNSNAHNARFYHRPSDGRMLLFPWDMDFAFILGPTSALVVNSELRKIIAEPKYERAFYGHVLDIVNRAFNEDYMNRWIDHYEDKLTRQNLGAIKSFVRSRAGRAVRFAESAIAPVDFAITTNGGADFSSDSASATLEGDGWVNVREIRIVESGASLTIDWTSGSTWQVSVPLGTGATSLTLKAIDFEGNVIATDAITVTNTSPFVAATAGNLLISEMMYNPAPLNESELAAGIADKESLEFIEFFNPTSSSVDLSGVRVADGVEFTFLESTILHSQLRIVAVRDAAAFLARYPAALADIYIAGEFTKSLSNTGERIRVLAADGSEILNFAYNDKPPWPKTTDGEGDSLTLIAPDRTAFPDLDDPVNWRTGRDVHGLPGFDDRIRYVDWKKANGVQNDLGDPDGDSKANLWEYACGSDPNQMDGPSPIEIAREGSKLTLSIRQEIGTDDVEFSAQASSDLVTWSTQALEYAGSTILANGTRALHFKIIDNQSAVYFRVTATLRK